MGKKYLVIPDSHAHPDFSNRRYNWLGRLVNDIKPDVVVDIGDWPDMPSLCDYEKGKKSFEGRRYQADIAASLDAQERMFDEIRAAKRKLPQFVKLIGNHDNRINRAISLDAAKLEGTIGLEDLEYERYWDVIVPYEGSTPGVFVQDGVAFAHYFISGVMGRPISGERPASQLIAKQHISCVQGHIHTTDYIVRGTGNGKHIHGLVVGVYQDYDADYAGNANRLWWRGVNVLHEVEDGQFDPEWISMDRIRKEYSK